MKIWKTIAIVSAIITLLGLVAGTIYYLIKKNNSSPHAWEGLK